MKETFYFSHDYNARSDAKIKRLLQKHGMCGYGIYWSIIEDLYQNANAMRTDYECIAYDMRVQSEMIKSIVNDFDLFVISGDIFGSLSVQRRLDERNEKSKKARESATYRWNKPGVDANAMRTQCDSNAIKESKGNKSKGNNKGNITHTKFIKPSIQEIEKYCTERNNGIDAEYFFNFYESKNWMIGKNKMKNWQSAIITWEKSNNQKQKNNGNELSRDGSYN